MDNKVLRRTAMAAVITVLSAAISACGTSSTAERFNASVSYVVVERP